MNLLLDFKTKPFIEAVQSFFKNLNVPFNVISNLQTDPKNIIGDKKCNENIEAIYPFGIVTNEIFNNPETKITQADLKNDKYEGVLLFGVALSKEKQNPTRTDLAEIARQINREFSQTPVVVVFHYANKLTFANAERIDYKQTWREGEKVGKISMLKDIEIEKPHRAHQDILKELGTHKAINFDELYQYWQKVLNTKELNKVFYKELFNWYLWAVQKVQFPKPENDTTENKTYQSQAVIRLITRLIFVWFLKEKKLIPSKTFEIDYLKNLLNDFEFNGKTSGSFYNAILQNLFFATLNSPLNKDTKDDYEIRKFIDDVSRHPKNTDVYNDQTKYRGKELFKNPEKLIELFNDIPFLNGGLFECLDRKEERQDGFSSNANKRAFVPNILFFGTEIADFSDEIKDKNATKTTVKGIISILNDYKFTIEENTPLEEDIALDPELLGKVFENLLASYNPETKDSVTARKQTGSFYTPREIVDYMVIESLLAYMQNYFPDLQSFEKLSNLNEDEKYIFVKKLTDIKILDPACGSGAYPMGVLHKMVELIKTIDPENLLLKEIQKNRIIGDKVAELLNDKEQIKNLSDDDVREKSLKAVEDRLQNLEEIFGKEYDDSNYLRKLFLIEYCIFGVDIQTIAIQISKLRFFISLLIDQKIDESQPNRGILSMPNLETKFVAANTLIGLETSKNGQIKAESEEVLKIEKELDEIRHKIFYLKRFSDKKKLKIKEAEKREELKKTLIDSGLGEATATQKAEWNPFDILHSAPFFDAKTMFGLSANQSNELVRQLNKQIDAINKQIDAINHSLKIDLHKVIKLQTQVIDNQLDVIQIEIEYIAKRISKIYGEINQEVKDIVSEPKNYDYELYPVKTKIDTINQQLQELKSNLSTSPSLGFFDVVIGNPPYGASTSASEKEYFKANYLTTKSIKNIQKGSLDTYSLFIELGHKILSKNGSLIYIIPISITSSESMTATHNLLESTCSKIKISSYSVRPQPVFENAVVNTSILFFKKDYKTNETILSTKMYRKNKVINLKKLVENLEFIDVKKHKLYGAIPKISHKIEFDILDKIFSNQQLLNLTDQNGSPVYYRTVGGRYFKIVTNYSTLSNKETHINFKNNYSDLIACFLSSNLSFWFYQIYGDNLSWKSRQIMSFTFPKVEINDTLKKELLGIYNLYIEDIEKNSNTRKVTESSKYTMEYFKEYKIGKSKHLIDKIDDLIGPLYGLTKEEIEFIKNYEIEYRISDEE